MELGNLIFGSSRGQYEMNREDFEDIFHSFLYGIGSDIYGYGPNGENPYETELFVLRPYCWEDDEEMKSLPNFVYKPLGLEVRWYKYALRDAYCSQNIAPEELEEILKHCAKKKGGSNDSPEKINQG